MTDRNSNLSFRPRDAERYAELSDLLGDIGADVPIAPRDHGFDLEQTPSLESVLANVDANYLARPREVLLGGLAAPKDWNANQSAFSRATPSAAPLEPKVLDAWDLRPALEPEANVETELFEVEVVEVTNVQAPALEAAIENVAADDEDAFLSALDGLEDDILGDAELSDYADPFEVEVTGSAEVNAAEPEVVHIKVAEAFEPIADLDETFDDSIFDDLPDLTPDTMASPNAPAAEHLFEEPEFEDIDFDLPPATVATTEAMGAPTTYTGSQSTIAATAVSGGLGAVWGSIRANASRETHADAGDLPVTALPAAHNSAANAEPVFPNTATPYDDVPVTGSLKVPDFIAPETNVPQRSMGFDEFEIDEFKPTRVSVPVDVSLSNATAHPETIVHEPVRNQPAVTQQATEDALDDLDFGNAFDDDFSPTDELADLVGSNVTTDPLMPSAKDNDFAPMPAMPPIVAARSGRGKWMAIGAFGLALVGGLALYGSSGDSTDTNAEPAVVRADNEPVRVAPENPGGTVVPNQDRVVFNEVGGSNAVPEQPQETLVDSRQEPAIAAAPVKEEDRVLNGDNSAELAAPEGTAIAPRSVQTVTVRPDGTLVANPPVEQAAAAPQAEVVPETRPETTAAQPMPESTNPVAEIAAASVPETPVAETPTLEAPVAEAPVVEETIAAKVPAKVVETKPVVQKAKVKAPKAEAKALDAVPSRPSDQPVNVLNGDAPALPEQPAEQQTASVEPAAADALAAGVYAIQIASTPSEEAATSTLRSLSRKYGSILAGKDYAIQRAEVPGKGTMYRVRILAGSKADAGKLCSRYKSAGGSCFVTR